MQQRPEYQIDHRLDRGGRGSIRGFASCESHLEFSSAATAKGVNDRADADHPADRSIPDRGRVATRRSLTGVSMNRFSVNQKI